MKSFMVSPEMLFLPLQIVMEKVGRVPNLLLRVEEELVEVVTFAIPIRGVCFLCGMGYLFSVGPCEG